MAFLLLLHEKQQTAVFPVVGNVDFFFRLPLNAKLTILVNKPRFIVAEPRKSYGCIMQRYKVFLLNMTTETRSRIKLMFGMHRKIVAGR